MLERAGPDRPRFLRAGARSVAVPSRGALGGVRRRAPRRLRWIWWGQRLGRRERSARPARPACSYRAIQLFTLWGETPRRLPTSVTFQPSRTTTSTAWYGCSTTLSSSNMLGSVTDQVEPV